MLIAQVSDTHIVAKNRHWQAEPLTEIHKRLSKVIGYLNALDPAPDVVLFTGDITDEGDKDAYYYFKELVSPLKFPYFVIPGNHDQREEMRLAFIEEPYMPKRGFIHYSIENYPVRLIGLDTLVEGEAYGKICKERLDWFEQTLKASPEKPTLIFMHHPPTKLGVKLFDEIICFTPDEFHSLILKYDNLLGIVAGHYHHFCVSSFFGKGCFIAPSVAPVHYFAHPNDDRVTALELEDPAVSLHLWQEERPLISHVKRVKENYRRIDWQEIQKKQMPQINI
jgi:3',5'-cyclic-AMP phosphodiesterase